jgi:hypothetical protein
VIAMFDLIKQVLAEKEKEKQKEMQKQENAESGKTEEKEILENKVADVNNTSSDRFWFVAEQLLFLARESYVKKPDDITYQFSRELAGRIITEKYSSDNALVKEGLAIGMYKGVESLLKKLLK